ncbi:unnamed protein product, partial [Rotaria socialis]
PFDLINDFDLDEEIFNDANEAKFRECINGVALSSEVQQKIRDDVKNLLDQ